MSQSFDALGVSAQVQEALKLLHGLPVSAGEGLIWNGEANHFYKTAFQRREDCLSHETYPEPIELPLSASSNISCSTRAFSNPKGRCLRPSSSRWSM